MRRLSFRRGEGLCHHCSDGGTRRRRSSRSLYCSRRRRPRIRAGQPSLGYSRATRDKKKQQQLPFFFVKKFPLTASDALANATHHAQAESNALTDQMTA